MSNDESSALEYVFVFGGVVIGLAIMLGLGILVLPKGLIPFALYGMVGAVGGGLTGQYFWRRVSGK